MLETLSRNQRKDLKDSLELAHRKSQAPWSPSGWANPLASCVNRRAFLRGGAGLIGGAAIGKTLLGLSAPRAEAAQPCSAGGASVSPWGAPIPSLDPETGLNLITLPPGFSYRSFGWRGDLMQDGTPTPALHDGMAVIQELGPNHLLLVRNHEVNHPGPAAFGPVSIQYDPICGGGTSNLIFDLQPSDSSQPYPAKAVRSATAPAV